MTTAKKTVAKKAAAPTKKDEPQKAHPWQAIDTDVPDGETVDEKAFKALQDAYEGDPDE